jgi:hypothetical protein
VVFGQFFHRFRLVRWLIFSDRRFPPARVWPPLQTDKRYNAHMNGSDNDEHLSKLPDFETQDHLLELYFTYVHPSLPVVHKKAFFEVFRQG